MRPRSPFSPGRAEPWGAPRGSYTTPWEEQQLLSCLQMGLGGAFYMRFLPRKGIPSCLFFRAADMVRASPLRTACPWSLFPRLLP